MVFMRDMVYEDNMHIKKITFYSLFFLETIRLDIILILWNLFYVVSF